MGTVLDTSLALVVAVLLLMAGAALLTAGAELFAEHVTAASSRLGVSVLALAFLLAGAEPEEAVTAMLASGRGHPALAAGDALGANLVVLTLVVGLAATLAPLPVSRRVLEYAAAAVVAGVVAFALLHNGVLSRLEGLLLVLLYGGAVVWVWRREQEPPVVGEVAKLAEETGRVPVPANATDEQTSRALLRVLAGVVGMVVGGYLAVRGAERAVDALDLRESVVGLSLLALATSAEMVALVWAARRRGLTEIVVAGAVGAVVYNATMTLGLAALVSPLLLGRHNPVQTVAALTAALPVALLAGRPTGTLPRVVGGLLVAAYVVAVGWLFAF